jgi:prepilin-type N-terminal cleavage/methylation domain-containing protein
MQPLAKRLKDAGPGFTLVELLVVVAIIALLLGILLPALGKAREMAQSVKCLTQVKQLAQAGFMYAEDNEGHWCNHIFWGRGSDFLESENAENLLPYLGLKRDNAEDNSKETIFTCPTMVGIKQPGVPSGFKRTLTMNYYAAWDYVNHPLKPRMFRNIHGYKMTNVKRPSEMAYFMDGIAVFEAPQWDGWYYESSVRWRDGGREGSLWYAVEQNEAVYPHGQDDQWNIAFVDGHGDKVDRVFLEETILNIVPELPDAHPFWGDTRPNNNIYE